MVWYSHLFKNFPQFVVIHIVKGFGIVNKAEVDVGFFGGELSCFFDDPEEVCNCSLVPLLMLLLLLLLLLSHFSRVRLYATP